MQSTLDTDPATAKHSVEDTETLGKVDSAPGRVADASVYDSSLDEPELEPSVQLTRTPKFLHFQHFTPADWPAKLDDGIGSKWIEQAPTTDWSDLLKGKQPFKARHTIVQEMTDVLLSGEGDLRSRLLSAHFWVPEDISGGMKYSSTGNDWTMEWVNRAKGVELTALSAAEWAHSTMVKGDWDERLEFQWTSDRAAGYVKIKLVLTHKNDVFWRFEADTASAPIIEGGHMGANGYSCRASEDDKNTLKFDVLDLKPRNALPPLVASKSGSSDSSAGQADAC